MDLKIAESVIEAVLFASGDPVTKEELVNITGLDNAGEEWGDLYVIKELTRTDMTWVGVNDPTFVQTFSRIQK